MTTPDNAQPEALRLAERLSRGGWPTYVPQEAAAKLLRQHDEIQQLKAQLSQAQAVPTDSLLSLEASAHEIFNDPEICTPQKVLDMIEWYAASVRAALAASPTPPVQQKYRLLVRGVDVIEPADEFLQEDGVSWATCSIGIFFGMPYRGSVLLPARRPLGIGAAHGIQGEGNE